MYSIEHALKKKEEKQNIAVKASFDHSFLFLEWFTGLGKSLAALRILKEHKGNWVIVVKEVNHMITWRDEAEKWKISLSNVEIITYDSLHKLSGRKNYNLILDEAHAITSLRLKKLKKLKINRVVALTATMPQGKKALLNRLNKFTYYPITMGKAIEEGIVPEPEIIQLMVTLTPSQMAKYKAINSKISYAINENLDNLRNILGSQRKRMLSSYKTAAARKILDKSKRFVCFTGSIAQCNQLGGKNVVHSKTKDKEVITKFNDLKIDNLFAVNMLRESMNLRNIDVGYIIQLDNQEKSFIQMLGRSFRSLKPIVYVITCKDTVDESYAKTAFQSIPEKYIKRKNA